MKSQILFRVSDYKSSCLLSELLLKGSLKIVNPIAINKEGWWALYATSSKLNKAEKEGFRLLSNQNIFNKYTLEFENNLSYSAKNIIPKYYDRKINSLTSSEFRNLFNQLCTFWQFYGYTEYIFTDYAYKCINESRNTCKIINSNIKKLGEIKNKARSTWNKYTAEKGVLKNIFDYINNNYYKDSDVAKYLTSSEISDTLKGVRVSEDRASKRKHSYLIKLNVLNKIKFEKDSVAKDLTDKFYSQDLNEIQSNKGIVKGIIACQGMAVGKAFVVPMFNAKDASKHLNNMDKGSILLAQSTNPDLILLMKKASAIVTDQGGLLSHAAIISRELGIPCLVGTKNATKVFKTGDMIEVDAIKGTITKK